ASPAVVTRLARPPTRAGTAAPRAVCVLAGVSPSTLDTFLSVSPRKSPSSWVIRFVTGVHPPSHTDRSHDRGARTTSRAGISGAAHPLPRVLDHRLVLSPRAGILFLPDSSGVRFNRIPWAAAERLACGEVVTEVKRRLEVLVRHAALGEVVPDESAEVALV